VEEAEVLLVLVRIGAARFFSSHRGMHLLVFVAVVEFSMAS